MANPVFFVPVNSGMASRAANASDRGVSLYYIDASEKDKTMLALYSYHLYAPYLGAGDTTVSGFSELCLLVRQHEPEVQLASEPVEYPVRSWVNIVSS